LHYYPASVPVLHRRGEVAISVLTTPYRAEEEYTGRVIGDRYEVGHVLGVGSNGAVYEGYDRISGSRVAVKVYCGKPGDRLGPLFRLWKYMPLLKSLSHPGCASVLALFLEGNDALMVREMVDDFSEFVPGIRRVASLRELKAFAGSIASGVHHCNQQSVLHGNLSPANVFTRSNGDVVLTDFAVSYLIHLREPVGAGILSPYAAPELGRGAVDHRADMYSLGVLLGESVAAYVAGTVGGGTGASWPAFSAASDIPDGWGMLIQRLVARDPNDRFSSFADVERVISDLSADDGGAVSLLSASDARRQHSMVAALQPAVQLLSEDPLWTAACDIDDPDPIARVSEPVVIAAIVDPVAGGVDAGSAASSGSISESLIECEPEHLRCSACGSDDLSAVQVSRRGVYRFTLSPRFELSCNACLHAAVIGEREMASYNPFATYERLTREQ
jgi:hypothetical protein